MPSTYTVNLGIEKPATGEQSGTWGDTTNINFDIIDQAINGAISITLASAGTSGSPNTLAISDGATSDGRNKWIEFVDGGDLGATAYVQLTPNDAEKIVLIRNSLSGSRSVILFQGTYDAARDVEVPAGVDMLVKFSGGGATATTTNVFQRLRVEELNIAGTTTVDGVIDDDTMGTASATKLATSESIKAYVDSSVGAQDTLSEILANGNTSGGNDLQMTTTDELQFRDTALKISSSADGQLDIDADTEIEIVAPTVDIDASTAMTIDTAALTVTGAVDFNTSLNVDGTVTSDGLTVDGSATVNTSGTTLINYNYSGANKGGVTTDGINISQNAVANLYLNVNSGNRASFAGNGDIVFYDTSGNTSFFYDESAGSVFNEQGDNKDFRVESDANTHALFVDASAEGVGIFASSVGGGYALTVGELGINVVENGAVSHITANRGYSVNTGSANSSFRVATLDGIGSRIKVRVVGSIGYGNPGFQEYIIEAGQGNISDEFGVNIYAIGNTDQMVPFQISLAEVTPYTDRIDGDTYDLWLLLGHFARVDIFVEEISGTTVRFDNYSGTGASIPGTAVTTNNNSTLGLGAQSVQIQAMNTAETSKREVLSASYDEVVINQLAANVDFRVESDSNANALHVDGDLSLVGINRIASGAYLHIAGNFEGTYALKLDNSQGTGQEWGIRSHGVNGERLAWYDVDAGQQYMAFSSASVEGVIFNEDAEDQDFRIESTTATHMFFVDASTDRIGINTSSSAGTVQIRNTDENGALLSLTPSLVFQDQSNSYTDGHYYNAISWARANSNGGTPGVMMAPVMDSAGATKGFEIHVGAGNTNVQNRLKFNGSETVFNEDSYGRDFRIESDNQSDIFFVDASEDRIGVSTTSPNYLFDIVAPDNTDIALNVQAGNSENSSMTIGAFGSSSTNGIPALIPTGSLFGGLLQGGNNGKLVLGIRDNDTTDSFMVVSGGGDWHTDNTYDTKIMELTANGNSYFYYGTYFSTGVVVNEGGNSGGDFRVESSTNNYMIFADAGESQVGINTNSFAGDYSLVVNGVGGALDGTSATTNSKAAVRIASTGSGTLGTGTSLYFGIQDSNVAWIQAQHVSDNGEKELHLNPAGGPVVINEIGDASGDLRVEGDGNSQALFVDASKDQVLMHGNLNASLVQKNSKWGRFSGKFINSGGAAVAASTALLNIASWQSGNSRLFGTVEYWSVNPVSSASGHGRAKFLAINGGTNVVGTFTNLEEYGSLGVPTISWNGNQLEFDCPARAYQMWFVDITYCTYDGATVTLYPDYVALN